MPTHNMQVAMNLYQPSGRNGKIMKALFPWLHHLLIIRKIIHAESVYCDITDELKRLFCQLFHETEIEFRSFVVLLAYIKRLQCKSAKESIF